MKVFPEKVLKLKVEDFKQLKSTSDIAHLFDCELKYLTFLLYVLKEERKYTRFLIPKKGGGEREIFAPIPPIKIIQKNLSLIFNEIWEVKKRIVVHGFVPERNIVTNAKIHVRQKHVLNVDLRNFFPTINFGRVRGMFMATPFNFNNKVATILAQICCFKNHLPQGAPTSPMVSNFICFKLDVQLFNFAKENNCYYTRYADDITFSTFSKTFPIALTLKNSPSENALKKGELLKAIINKNGFDVNERKISLRSCAERQAVTGIIVNRFPNIRRKYYRQIRAILHAWKKFGYDLAEKEFHNKFNFKYINPDRKDISLRKVLDGRIGYIGFVRGKDDPLYRKIVTELKYLNSDTSLKVSLSKEERVPLVITEGPTDWRHIKNAFTKFKQIGRYRGLSLQFSQYNGPMGNKMLHMVAQIKQLDFDRIKILIFDSDDSKSEDMHDYKGNPRYWGNGTYTFILPFPSHRISESGISIEHYYKDNEITTKDLLRNKRLYLSPEFDSASKRHKAENFICSNTRIPIKGTKIIDANSINRNTGYIIALTKFNFAENIYKRKPGFDNFDISEFSKIIDKISEIIKLHNLRI